MREGGPGSAQRRRTGCPGAPGSSTHRPVGTRTLPSAGRADRHQDEPAGDSAPMGSLRGWREPRRAPQDTAFDHTLMGQQVLQTQK